MRIAFAVEHLGGGLDAVDHLLDGRVALEHGHKRLADRAAGVALLGNLRIGGADVSGDKTLDPPLERGIAAGDRHDEADGEGDGRDRQGDADLVLEQPRDGEAEDHHQRIDSW